LQATGERSGRSMPSILGGDSAGDEGERETGGGSGVGTRARKGNDLKYHSLQQPEAIWIGPWFGSQNWRFLVPSAGFIGAYNFSYGFGMVTGSDRRPFFCSKP
jgi:hypothetical protein